MIQKFNTAKKQGEYVMNDRDRMALKVMLASTAAVLAFPVLAQTSTTGSTEDAANATPSTSDIVVTGSRLARTGDDMPTPVTVVSNEVLKETTPSSIYDGLQKLPQFTPQSGQRGKFGATGSFLDLRGLGPNRNLILFDGHRRPPTTLSGAVDTSTIPEMLVQRVEVVTGGASAVYGSDAVTGVINYIIDKKFTGIKAEVQQGISERGDNANYRLGAAFGTDLFGGRGHLLVSGQHYKSDGIPRLSERDNPLSFGGLLGTVRGGGAPGSRTNPLGVFSYIGSANPGYGGHFNSSALFDKTFDQGGVLRNYIHGTITGTTGYEAGPGDATRADMTLLAKLKTDQVFGRFDFDVTDSVGFYAQGSYATSETRNTQVPVYTVFQTLRADNAFLSQAARDTLAAAGNRSFFYSRTNIDTPPLTTRVRTKNYYFNTGFEGQIGNFDWDASYSYGRTRFSTQIHNLDIAKYLAATDAVFGPGGNIVCRVTITNPGLYPGCTPLNLFNGPQTNTPAGWDYVRNYTDSIVTNQMHDLAGTITGSPFSTWAGPARIAFSAEWRRESLKTTSNDLGAPLDCTGLAGTSCGVGLYTPKNLQGTLTPVTAAQSVTEAALEAEVPLLKDVAFAEALSINGAVRYTRYQTSGSVVTWKVGGDWNLGAGLRFRGTLSRDIRAPTLYDLFGPVSLTSAGFTDAHTGIASGTTVRTQGNPDLDPEKSTTLTFGAVYRPEWAQNLSIAIDYYRIQINDAISALSGTNPLVSQLCEDSNGTSPYCALIIRPLPFSDRSAANYPTLLLSQPVNVAKLRTWGIDGEINYNFALAEGSVSLRGLVSYQPQLASVQFPGQPEIDQAGSATSPVNPNNASSPKVRVTALVGYRKDGFSIATQTRWRSSVSLNNDPRLFFDKPYRVKSAWFTDMTISQSVAATGGKAEFFLTVENLFDKDPAPYPGSIGAVSVGFESRELNFDDVAGRRFTVGVRAKF